MLDNVLDEVPDDGPATAALASSHESGATTNTEKTLARVRSWSLQTPVAVPRGSLSVLDSGDSNHETRRARYNLVENLVENFVEHPAAPRN